MPIIVCNPHNTLICRCYCNFIGKMYSSSKVTLNLCENRFSYASDVILWTYLFYEPIIYHFRFCLKYVSTRISCNSVFTFKCRRPSKRELDKYEVCYHIQGTVLNVIKESWWYIICCCVRYVTALFKSISVVSCKDVTPPPSHTHTSKVFTILFELFSSSQGHLNITCSPCGRVLKI